MKIFNITGIERIECDENKDILIKAEKGSSAEIVLRNSCNVEVIAEKGSKVRFITLHNTGNKKINIKKDAEVEWLEFHLGSVDSEAVINLDEEGASAKKIELFLGKETDEQNIHTKIIHNAPRTVSNILSRGILNDNAKSFSNSLIRIEKSAEESSGQEKHDALLLSENAKASATPKLEVFNKEVKCSHGATVGQIDKDQIFYLMSRGLDEKQAKQQIIKGYFAPIIEEIGNLEIEKAIEEAIQ